MIPDDADALLQTLKGEAQTLVRSPSSTVAPPQDGLVGRRALEILKGLVFDPKALTDEGPLGQGGMGVVRLAKQVALDRHVGGLWWPEHRFVFASTGNLALIINAIVVFNPSP